MVIGPCSVSANFGATFQNFGSESFQSLRISCARREPVSSWWRSMSAWSSSMSSGRVTCSRPTSSWFTRERKSPCSSSTKATPFDMPAPKLRPVAPRITITPSVMYSQQ